MWCHLIKRRTNGNNLLMYYKCNKRDGSVTRTNKSTSRSGQNLAQRKLFIVLERHSHRSMLLVNRKNDKLLDFSGYLVYHIRLQSLSLQLIQIKTLFIYILSIHKFLINYILWCLGWIQAPWMGLRSSPLGRHYKTRAGESRCREALNAGTAVHRNVKVKADKEKVRCRN